MSWAEIPGLLEVLHLVVYRKDILVADIDQLFALIVVVQTEKFVDLGLDDAKLLEVGPDVSGLDDARLLGAQRDLEVGTPSLTSA